MRTLPIFAAVVLSLSGTLAILFPRALMVRHMRASGRWVTVEWVSKTGCRNYGILAIAAGVFLAWGELGVSCVPITDRGIAKSIVRTKKKLEEDYGDTEHCTVMQIEAAVRALRVSPKHLPYLCAAFMGKGEFDQLRASMPDVDWEKIEETISRIALELPYNELCGDHFHESWIATVDN